MKRITDLKTERATLIASMQEIVTRSVDAEGNPVKDAEGKLVERTEADTKTWNEADKRVMVIDAEVKVLERQAALNLTIAGAAPVKEIDKVTKRYDLVKAIREARTGGVTGLEAEMHQEAERELAKTTGVVGNLFIPAMLIKRANEATKTTELAAGHIPTQVGGLDVVAASPLYRELGCTIYEGLSAGKLDIPFSKGHTAAAVAEESAAAQSVPTDTKGTLTASRYQGWQTFTNEYLAESALMGQVIADMVESIDRGIGADMAVLVVTANIMSGFEAATATAALTWNGVLDIIADVESSSFKREGFVASKALFYELAAMPKVATYSAEMVISFLEGNNKGRIAGIGVDGTSFLPVHDTDSYDLAYGDFAKAYIGMWSGVQLLVDPYTASDDGYTKITFSRMADVVVNPYGFASKRNCGIS